MVTSWPLWFKALYLFYQVGPYQVQSFSLRDPVARAGVGAGERINEFLETPTTWESYQNEVGFEDNSSGEKKKFEKQSKIVMFSLN